MYCRSSSIIILDIIFCGGEWLPDVSVFTLSSSPQCKRLNSD